MTGKPKTKLEGLEVRKVDFVDVGADQQANIMIRKRDEPNEESVLKKFFHSFLEAFNIVSKSENSAVSFNEKMEERNLDKVRDEVWNASYALQNSIASILAESEVNDKVAAIHQSIDQFCTYAKEAAKQWSNFKTTDEIEKSDILPDAFEVMKMQELVKRVDEKELEPENKKKPGKEVKDKEENEVKLDVNKMSPGERAFLEEIQKKYALEETPEDGNGAAGTSSVKKSEQDVDVKEEVQKAVKAAVDEVMKGVNAQMQAMFEPMKKRAEELEDAEFMSVAKKYTILGSKPDELVPVLKKLKSVSDEAYDGFIAQMDSQLQAVEKLGIFSEIGKSGGHGADEGTEAIAKAHTKAEEIKKSMPNITMEQALDIVFQNDPELRSAVE